VDVGGESTRPGKRAEVTALVVQVTPFGKGASAADVVVSLLLEAGSKSWPSFSA
jgi:hypothetical protein